jgi:hypothetical protein
LVIETHNLYHDPAVEKPSSSYVILRSHELGFTSQSIADEGEPAEVPLEPEDDLERIAKEQGYDHAEPDHRCDQGQGHEQLDDHQPT